MRDISWWDELPNLSINNSVKKKKRSSYRNFDVISMFSYAMGLPEVANILSILFCIKKIENKYSCITW